MGKTNHRALAGVLALFMLLSLQAAAPARADGQLKVYASFYVMYDFAAKVGGDKVEVINMVPAGIEPHEWEPAASDLVGLESADVFVYNGIGMEHWVDGVLSALTNGDLVVVEASAGLDLSAGHGDEGGEQQENLDPHVWLDPINAKAEMLAIKDALVQADPDDAEYYEANFATWATEFDALDQEFIAALFGLSSRDIIVAHQAFGYLCGAYDLNQVGIEGLMPDSEPDPARMAEIIGYAKEHAIGTIFFEDLVSPKVAETIASAIGAKTEILSPIEGLSDEQIAAGGDYFSVMRQNLQALTAALG